MGRRWPVGFRIQSYSPVKERTETSLVVHWLRFCTPAAGAWVQSLVSEVYPKCHN